MSTEMRGKFVLGLQPYDRMPNDWLRMVSRVFASYRKEPLEESIVAYIDGLNLSLISGGGFNDSYAKIGITPGQAFVDDQFIGFIENSTLDITTVWMNIDQEYCVVLHYEWINRMEPQEPHFYLSRQPTSVVQNSQQDLCLGYAIKRTDGTNTWVEIIDAKVPWYKEMVVAMTGDTEVDTVDDLPYIIKINEPNSEHNPAYGDPDHNIDYEVDRQQTLDIGWALDFHDEVGNLVDYDTRLHTDRTNPGDLYINNKKILIGINPYDPNLEEDPSDPGDAYLGIQNNIIISDTQRLNMDNTPVNPSSNTGKACYGIRVQPEDPNDADQGASLCFDISDTSTSLRNTYDYNITDGSANINVLKLTNEVDNVTINGKSIWHTGNLESSGKNIYFLGVYTDADPDDFPQERLDGSQLQDGDTLYNSNYQAYFFWQTGTWVQVGKTESSKQYEFEGVDGQTSVKCNYNPNFVIVTVSGVTLSKADFVANDGEYVIFNRELQDGEMVTIHTVLGGLNIGIALEELADISFMNLQEFDVLSYRSVGQPGNYHWTNAPVSINKLQDVNNVQSNTISDRSVLSYDASSDYWNAVPFPEYTMSGIKDVYIDTPQEGEILQLRQRYDTGGNPLGVDWVNVDFYSALPQDLGVITGGITLWSGAAAPAGYFECNGAAISRGAYHELFAIIGTRYGAGDGTTTFNLPDLRGEFVRGWDNGRGVDANRSLGTTQHNTIQNIVGGIGHPGTGTYDSLFVQDNPPSTGAFVSVTGSYRFQSANGSVISSTGQLQFDASRVVDTSNEVRPRNVSMMYIIKY